MGSRGLMGLGLSRIRGPSFLVNRKYGDFRHENGVPGHIIRYTIVNPNKLETGLRINSAGIPYTLLSGIEASD